MGEKKSFIGLDVGGTSLKVLALSGDGQIIADQTVPTSDDGTNHWLDGARTLVQSALTRCPADAAVGVSAPGLPAPDGYAIASMPGRLKGLEGLNWQQWLGLSEPVPVFNDAQAALLGEVWLGAAKGASNVVLLTLGTGVGGAAMVDGRVLRGQLGRAGHLGHVSLNPDGPMDIVNTPGSLEDAIGEHNLAARSSGLFTTTRELVAAYRDDSAKAAAVWLASLKALAAALTGFINILDPEIIIIGGGIAEADDALFKPLETMLDKFEWRPGGTRVRVVKAGLGRNAGAIGAAYGAQLATSNFNPASL